MLRIQAGGSGTCPPPHLPSNAAPCVPRGLLAGGAAATRPPPSHPTASPTAAIWCAHLFGWALVWTVSLVEVWAESHQRRAAARAAEAARRRCAEEQRQTAEQQRRDEAMRRKWEEQMERLREQQMEAVSSRTLGRRQAAAAAAAATAEAGQAPAPAPPPPLLSMMSWQAELLRDIARQEGASQLPARAAAAAAEAQPPPLMRPVAAARTPKAAGASSGDLSERLDSGSLMPPAPEPPGGYPCGGGTEGAEAAGGAGAGASADVAAAGASAGLGLFRLILSLDLSYLVEHTQARARAAGVFGGVWVSGSGSAGRAWVWTEGACGARPDPAGPPLPGCLRL